MLHSVENLRMEFLRTTTQTTPVTPSKKREPLSTRRGEMFNLSRKPQVIPLRSASEGKS